MKSEIPLLLHMADHIRKIRIVEGESTREQFFSDFHVHDLLIQQFIQIGAAARKLPESFKNKHKDIPWVDIIDFRNVIVHDYQGIELKTVWDIMKDDLPLLEKFVTDYLKAHHDKHA